MIQGKKRQGFDTINSLIKSRNDEDCELAKILLMDAVYDYTPSQWGYLYSQLNYHSYAIMDSRDLQKYLYDKRQQERRANKGSNTE